MTQKTIRLPYKFDPRPYQLPLLQALDKGIKKHVWCLHRGCGKDLLALNYLICQAMQKRGVYLHCFPNFSQGKKAIWQSNHADDKGQVVGYLEHFPEELIKRRNGSDMSIELINGSMYHVMGLDGRNAARARGMNPNFVILSEYAFMDPESWYTIEPRLTQNNGTVIFASTPNGQNHFYHLYNHAVNHPETYYAKLLTIDDTSALPIGFIEEKRAEGIPEDFIQQEYYCSFTRGAAGSYYGKYIQDARNDDRICKVNIETDLQVHTGWDIGIGDSTSIWFFQQRKNGQIVFINYYENCGEGLEHYVNYLEEFKGKNKIVYGMHYVPHDTKSRDLCLGIERIEFLRNLGYTMTVVGKMLVDEGIQVVRSMLNQCIFDQEKCKHGINCLDFYRKKWNETLKVYYDEPLHDKYSHGCFIKGTKIILHYGEKNIEDIKVGDEILTPNGYKKVKKTFMYYAENTAEICLQGHKLIGTLNHKIFTKNGLKRIDELMHNDILYTIEDYEICQKIGFLGKERCLGFRDIFSLVKMKQSFTLMDTDINGMDTIIVVENLLKPIEVYDFEVEDDHCYYANGILVSNSDAFRYLAIGIKTIGQSGKLDAEKIKEMRMKNYGY